MKQTARHAGGLVAALTLGSLMTGIALAQTAPNQIQNQGQIEGVPGVQMPSPLPQPTISGTPLPYPAFGSPAPDVVRLTPKKGVPATISLADAIRIGVALSPTFASQNAAWYAIHAKYGAEKQLYYPGISGTATMQNAYSPVQSYVPNGSATGAHVQVGGQVLTETLGISLTQLVYDGGRTIAAIRSAKEADISGRATLLRQLQTLALNVANDYYAVLEDNATVTADAQLVREFEVNEASVAAQIRNGAAARSDIAAAQYQTAQARGNLVTAQGAAIGAQATFATTLGLDADALVVPRPLLAAPPAPNPSYTAALSRALLMRPDYIAASYSVESAQENLRYAKLARFPVLTGNASYNDNRSFPRIISPFEAPETGFLPYQGLGLQMTIPIYDQGVTNYNVASAASQLDQAIDALHLTKLTVESDVRSALATLISARASFVQARSELTSAQVALDATKEQYRVGASTVLLVVTAEANLSTAQSAYITALYGVYTAQQNYLYATGVSDVQL